MKLKIEKPLAFFDIESTGLDIISDRIVEIAIIKIHPNGERETFHKRINPEISIPIESSLIHGIYDKDVAFAPTFSELSKDIFAFLLGADFAGFNLLKLDIPILVESFLRESIDLKVEERTIVDVQKIFHLMEKRNLTAAYKFYCHSELENAHNAMADTEATLAVLEAQISRYENQEMVSLHGKALGKFKNDIETIAAINKSDFVDFAGRISKNDSGKYVFNFGANRGKLISDVLKENPGYYDWIMRSDFTLDTKTKLTKIKNEINNL